MCDGCKPDCGSKSIRWKVAAVDADPWKFFLELVNTPTIQGSISSMYYAKHICAQIPKAQKESNCQYLCALLGFVHAKGARARSKNVGRFWDLCTQKALALAPKMLAKLTQGDNFINVLWAAFAHVDPKSIKRYWGFDWILTLSGSTHVKAVRRTLLKLSPGVSTFYSSLFRKKVLWAAFFSLHFSFVIFWHKNILEKASHKMLMKSTTE